MGRNTKELILTTAHNAFVRDGSASVNSIIAEAGLSKGVFFHHFRSKQDLLIELINRDFEDRVERLKESARNLPDTPGRMLKAYVMAWIDYSAISGQELLNSLVVLGDPVIREKLAEQKKHILDMLWDPALPEITVHLIMSACTGSIALNIIDNDSPDAIIRSRKELAREMTRIIEQALDKQKCGEKDQPE